MNFNFILSFNKCFIESGLKEIEQMRLFRLIKRIIFANPFRKADKYFVLK